MFEIQAEFKTSPNIAVIKYWGKLDEDYIIPLNPSIGFTLNTDDLCTKTKVILSTENKEDTLLLNNENFGINKRLRRILDTFKSNHLDTLLEKIQKEKGITLNKNQFQYFKIESVNDFPTASGLASSASGLAAISVCLCHIFQIPEKLSEYARLGSGSACRSVYGGLVQWNGPNLEIMKEFFEKREKDINYLPDSATLQQLSNTCVSQQILQESQQFYENVKMLIFCANFSSKEVPSTGGMKQSTDSSDFLKTRVLETVPKHMQKITNAIKNNDFDTFCDVTIKDSNSFHSVCLDSQPPIFYLNEFSKLIIALVEKLNSDLVQAKKENKPYKIKNKIGYTYDAGPHAVLFIHKDSFDIIFAIFNQIFGLETCSLNKRAQNSLQDTLKIDVTEFQDLINFYKSRLTQQPSYLIQTEIGKGPSQI